MANTLTISKARKLLRLFARNAGDTTVYPTLMLDFALRRAANYLIREAHLCLRTDAQDTVASTSEYTITPAIFRCERLDSVYLTGTNVVVNMAPDAIYDESRYVRGGYRNYTLDHRTARLEIVDYTDLNDYAIDNPAQGQPTMIAFKSDTTYKLYPTPDQVYTVNRRWSDFFTTWELGIPTTSFTNNTAGTLSAPTVIDASDNQGTSLAAAFVDTGSGSGATITANLSNGSLYSLTLGTGGSNYSASTILTLGGYDSDDTTFNLDDSLLDEVISLGGPAFLQANDPEKLYATAKGQEFLAFVKRVAGKIGGLSVKRIVRRG